MKVRPADQLEKESIAIPPESIKLLHANTPMGLPADLLAMLIKRIEALEEDAGSLRDELEESQGEIDSLRDDIENLKWQV